MFATPDLSVYPSPTLSTGSLGPTTPSPYLPSGLFGYPTVFDPGHHLGNLSPVTGWDTASAFSPCGLMYPDEFELHAGGISEQQQQQQEAPVSAEEISCTTTQGMQVQLPSTQKGVHHPLCMRAHGSGDCDNGGAGDDGGGRCTPCTVDMSDIDPALLMDGGYSPFDFVVGPTRTATADDTAADMENPGSGGLGGSQHHVFQQMRHHHHHQQHPSQLGLALGTTTPELASISGPPPRQRRLQLLSRPTHDASSRTTTTAMTATDACSGSFNKDRDSKDVPESLLSRLPPAPGASSNSAPLAPRSDTSNPLINMIMFKFASPGVQLVAATPTPTTTTTTMSTAAAAAAAEVLGMRMIEAQAQELEQKHEVQLQLEDAKAKASVFDSTEGAGAGVSVNVPQAVLDGEEAAGARYRCQCQWDSPEAWLVQSDSIGEEVPVAATA
ncbi:hypothetical protein BGY98DRAFT_234147 [Russula aff. rugulosa BPL654]|nr:hypothetical protein BGY98DRAFT_234147 [Russula aff. rugulosa BPL654]